MGRLAILIFSIATLTSIDFFSKQYVESIWAGDLHSYLPVIGQYLGFQLSYNSGIAFSLPITGIPLQIITIAIILALLGYYFHTEYPKKSKLLDVGYTLIIAGAFSHAYERIFVGHVIDFIVIKYFAILNFADIFISIGALLLFVVYYDTSANNNVKNPPKI